MQTRLPWLGLALITACANLVLADDPTDALHKLLISPDMLMRHRDQIGLSDAQVEQIETVLEEAGSQGQQIEQRLNTATGRLAELLAATQQVDEEAALKQLDQVVAIEREQKRLHLRIMIQVRNVLTSQQREAALKIQQVATSTSELHERLTSKISRIHQAAQARAQAGQPPLEIMGIMQKIPELMQNGQVNEAEAVLDRALVMLGLSKAEQAGDAPNPFGGGLPPKLAEKVQQVQERAQQMQQDGEDVSQIQQLMNQLGPLIQRGKTDEASKLLDEVLKLTVRTKDQEAAADLSDFPSFAAVRAEVDALKKEDVAWRKIAWKTCLLDGLQESRKQHKPILLWVFIDRPIDDERC